MDRRYLNATSQNVKLIIIQRKITVLVKEITIAFPSYFKCMKNNKTMVALVDAINRAIGTLKKPRSM
jgi:hypothetical protein